MESQVCIACGQKRWRLIHQAGPYMVIECVGCGLGVTDPWPSNTEMASVNKQVYTLENRLRAYSRRRHEFEQRYQKQLDEIQSHHSGEIRTLLDVGCSLGFFLLEARKRGLEVVGAELSAESAEYAAMTNGLCVYNSPVEELSFPERRFDVVCLWDVLEHVPDPLRLLQELRRILKDDGLLVIQSPNLDSAMRRTCGQHWSWWLLPDHLFHFTPTALSKLLENAEYKVVHNFTWEPSRDLIYNVLTAKLPSLAESNPNFAPRLLRRLLYDTSMLVGPIVQPVQHLIWRKQHGALLVAYGMKN